LISGIIAQQSNVQCQSSSSWMDNEDGQDPCVVASNIGGTCYPGIEYVIGPLPQGDEYGGPSAQSDLNGCYCSTVFYSLMAACAVCQGDGVQNWSTWSQNCPQVWIENLPNGIPSCLAVPAWAFLDVVTGDTFDQNAAQNNENQPDSTSLVPSTTIMSTTSTTTQDNTFTDFETMTQTVTSTPTASTITQTSTQNSTQTVTPSSASTSSSGGTTSGDTGGGGSSSKTSSSSNAGAIAGGVVGGILGLGVIALLFYIARGRRREYPNNNLPDVGGAAIAFDEKGGHAYTPSTDTFNGSPMMQGRMEPPMAYEPNGPTIFQDRSSVGALTQDQGSYGGMSTPGVAGIGAGRTQIPYKGYAEV